MPKKPEVSIIIVNYHSKARLFACLDSILKSKSKTSFEIIVVDNDENEVITNDLKRNFPEVGYFKTKKNLGFGAANNLGAKNCRAGFLFFLNPDTLVLDQAIDDLVGFLKREKEVGLVAPLILSSSGKPYPVQGTGSLTPVSAVFALSFLNKYFPNNAISSNYWLKKWNEKTESAIGVTPGSAFLIRRQAFNGVSGFDQNFFLYFEEADLCRRLKKSGWQIFVEPKAKIIHFGGQSTPQNGQTKRIFRQSRFYYFKKNWGIILAIIVESFLRSAEFLAEKR